jgi:serine phosphatase RsbU (regulator of sigma subunit)
MKTGASGLPMQRVGTNFQTWATRRMSNPVRSFRVRNWLVAFLIAAPFALSAQVVRVPLGQCVYRLGDNPAWAAADVDPGGWKPYSDYHLTTDAWMMWVRCRAAFDASAIAHPVVVVDSDGFNKRQLFVDGRPADRISTGMPPIWSLAISPEHASPTHTFAVRVVQQELTPGLTPGRPAYLIFGDEPYIQAIIQTNAAKGAWSFLPVFSIYLVIGTSGLFLLGLFFFDRSQKAAFWLGLYCLAVCLPRLNWMGFVLLGENYPLSVESLSFGLTMFESWALVRVCFALAQRRFSPVYWVVFAAWVFIFLGSVLPLLLPARIALPLSLFVQVTCFKPIWFIWTFACTAPFVAFWPWTGLRGRIRIVAGLCAVWAVIEGWFQLQQVVLNRNTWSNQAQDWMSLAIAALVIAIFGYIFHEQRISADERAELRGELTAARQVQMRLLPQVAPAIPTLDYAGICIQARSVGGDYYDFLGLGETRLAVVVADIAGKGIGAALLMANLQATLRSQWLQLASQPEKALVLVNRALFENSEPHAYATLFYAEYDSELRRLRYANCGHLPGLLFHGTDVEKLQAANTVIGLFDVWECSVSETMMAGGDILVLHTDGATETTNDSGEEFGETRLIDAIGKNRNLSARLLAEAIMAEVISFSRGKQHDDLTVVVAKRII